MRETGSSTNDADRGRVSRAGIGDAPAIARVLREAFAEYEPLYTAAAYRATTPTAAQIERRWHEGPVWVARLGTQVVGTIGAVHRDGALYVRSMAILPAARTRGLGGLLLQEVEHHATGEQCTRLFLSTTPFLTGAIRLYERFGFVRTTDGPHDLSGTPVFTMEKVMPRGGDPVKGMLHRAFGYQGDHMRLPVADVDAALPFYETVLGFEVLSRGDAPHRSAVLGRDHVRIGLEANGGDSSQDGCAFHVEHLETLLGEFNANGLKKETSAIDTERHDGVEWRVFYVVAPDGLCYWFGERTAERPQE